MGYTPTSWNNGAPPAINAQNLNKVEQGISQLYINLSDFRVMTLLAANWTGQLPPHTYDLSSEFDNDIYNLTISVSPVAADGTTPTTETQYNDFAAAKICGSATQNVLTALASKPTNDIPVIVKVVRK